MLTQETLKIGGRYNWKNQPERLIYTGMCEPRNGRWHQFEKVDEPGNVWCEVLTSDLHMLEETPATAGVDSVDESAAEIERLEAEVERLTAERNELSTQAQHAHTEIRGAHAAMDEAGFPRLQPSDLPYSLIGRVKIGTRGVPPSRVPTIEEVLVSERRAMDKARPVNGFAASGVSVPDIKASDQAEQLPAAPPSKGEQHG